MSYELISALVLFAFVSSITPGPNNLMLMSSGLNYGFRLTLPHLLGVAIGFTLMIVLVGLGVMTLFDAFPVSYQILKVLSIVYLLYLAGKIALSSEADTNSFAKAKPMTFIQAALFQWVNPKAWTMALTAITIYAPTRSLIAILAVALVFGLVNLPCVSLWVMTGKKMQVILKERKHLKVFNVTMAVLLVLSLYPTLI
ncbi:LysE family translocator [Alteromonadaceae bacterium M269]|nr:LysE family translocator [Alteromonadaceae bacterium M269]